ncbi:plastid developmental protein DAG [Striga asiatica]|uniref:Plastid developmental protein DAG n=1 Tax=Striga asiatica TaxID=4170 RepID=A0A5A7R821_STRAF|nr:plastid developmental protein DAG [Striga asiatica]
MLESNVQTMMHKVLSTASSHFSAAVNLPSFLRRAGPTFHITCRRFFFSHPESAAAQPRTLAAELPRVDSLIDGCDYKHWLVVMQPPENYPQRDELVQQYVSTLALALGSEKAAMESIYSVSTKYYYSFSCQVDENVIHKIKSLPHVKWVLPDSYLSSKENGYGGVCDSYRASTLLSIHNLFTIHSAIGIRLMACKGNHVLMEKLFLTMRNITQIGCVITMARTTQRKTAQESVQGDEKGSRNYNPTDIFPKSVVVIYYTGKSECFFVRT